MAKKIYLNLIILCLSCASFAQKKNSFTYGFAVNSCFEEVIAKDPGIELSNARAIGFYLNAGWQTLVDSNFIIYTGLRFGTEKSLFAVERNGTRLDDNYIFSNHTLMLIFAPGLILTSKQRLFVTSAIGRFYQMNDGGSGVRDGRRRRSYTYAEKSTVNSFDYRLGIKWQLKMVGAKKPVIEFGVETSNIQHQGTIAIDTGYNNRPKDSYRIRYNVVIFYLGFMF